MNVVKYTKKLNRMFTYVYSKFHFSVSSLIYTIIYLDRIAKRKNVSITSSILFKYIVVLFACSLKYNEDYSIGSNKFYKQFIPTNIKKYNRLEYEILNLLDYKMYVYHDDYITYEQTVISYDHNIE